MSMFGGYLRSLVEVNKINIYGLAKQAGLERTAIHKIMSGGRIPAEEYVQKLAEALPLSPEERRRFLECYHISSIGEYKYNQRMQVKGLIESIAHIEKGSMMERYSYGATPEPVSTANSVAKGNFAVNNLIKNVMTEAMIFEGKQTIDFVIPDSYQYFYKELLACYTQNPQAQIRHIVPFSKKVDLVNNSNANIECLTHILPLVFVSGTGYSPHYFYRSISDIEITQAMPYFVLTSSNRLVLINRDFNRAVLICDKDIVRMYKESFENMLQQANKLIESFDSFFELLEYYISISNQNKGELFHWIEPEPCIGPLLTQELIEIIVKKDIPNRDALINLAYRNYRFLRENQLRNINICTTDGILRLIHTGMMYYAPKELIDPMPRSEMKETLDGLQKRVADNKVKILFSNPSKISLPSKTLLTINRKSGVNFIMGKGDECHPSKFMCISLSEDNINEAFVDFVESIEESGLVYSEEDSAKTLENIINAM